MVKFPPVSWWLEDPKFNSGLVYYLSCLGMLQILDRMAICQRLFSNSMGIKSTQILLITLQYPLQAHTPNLDGLWQLKTYSPTFSLNREWFNAFLFITTVKKSCNTTWYYIAFKWPIDLERPKIFRYTETKLNHLLFARVQLYSSICFSNT